MPKFFHSLVLMFGFCAFILPAVAAEDHATKDDAVKAVKAAVADINGRGPGATFTDITGRADKYVKKDLYLVAYDMDGKCLAHGQVPALVGMNLLGLKDVNGTAFVQERVTRAQHQNSFWHEYAYMNPMTHMVAPKESYCERSGDVIICGGVYK